MAAQITKLLVENYKSVGDRIELCFPAGKPLVLVGENNAGKSNVAKALGLVLGTFWPGAYEPDDNDFHGRVRDNPIKIRVEFSPTQKFGRFTSIDWRFEEGGDPPISFLGSPGSHFVRNEDRDTCACIVIEAERRLGYQLSYTSKWTYLSKLMHKFHDVMLAHADVKDELEKLFASTKEKFLQIPEFADFLRELRDQFDEMAGSMTYRLQVDFEAYNPVNFFHALRLQAAEGSEPRTLEEMGTGEQQILAMAFAYAYAKAFHGGIVLVLEEPEAHLHPLAQAWLGKRLNDMAAAGLQVLLTTHSASFVDVANLEGLVLVRKVCGQTRTVQLTAGDLVKVCEELGVASGKSTPTNILPFYKANATKEILEGFFTKVIVLVEGPTEALALPIYFERCGLNAEKEGIAIVPVQGKGNLAKWRRLFYAYGIPTYLIFDNDTDDDSKGVKRRDALISVGINESQTDEYIGASDWLVESEFCVFGKNFEVTLRKTFDTYTALEVEASSAGIDSKPFAARYVASRLQHNPQHAGWAQFEKVAGLLKEKAQHAASGSGN
jgi:putative ATP-dependent endonuclease of OLD family